MKPVKLYNAGFSLIEIAIVLIIIGILSHYGIRFMSVNRQREAEYQTRSNQEIILMTLATFVSQNGYLPCPADPTLEETHSEFGIARTVCDFQAQRGLIPFRSLGLSEKVARDGYHRWITYIVSYELTKTERLQPEGRANGSYCAQPMNDFLRAHDGKGHDLFISNTLRREEENTESIAVILISHGENGYGAYQERGIQLVSAPLYGQDEEFNRLNVQEVIDRLHQLSADKSYFDDTVAWATRHNLLTFVKQSCLPVNNTSINFP